VVSVYVQNRTASDVDVSVQYEDLEIELGRCVDRSGVTSTGIMLAHEVDECELLGELCLDDRGY